MHIEPRSPIAPISKYLQTCCFDFGNRSLDEWTACAASRCSSKSPATAVLPAPPAGCGISKSVTTKHVAWLEQSLGAKLLNRTTKHVGLTEAGAHALSQGQLLLYGYEEIGAGARELVQQPRGIIRVGTPPSFGTHHLLPLVASFTERYPDIRILLLLDDGSAN